MKTALRNHFYSTLRILLRQAGLVLISLFISSALMLLSGYNPFDIFRGIARGVSADIRGTFRWAIPLILTGLSVSVAFRSKIFNLGMDGQLYFGAIGAILAAFFFDGAASGLAVPLIFLWAAFFGGLFALLPGLLYVLWNTNLVVSTLLLNFIALLFAEFMVLGPIKGEGALGIGMSSDKINQNFWLPNLPGTQISAGLLIALMVVGLTYLLIYKTTLGYQAKLVGANPLFARYSGIGSKKIVLIVVAISGAVAGLAGALEIVGVHRRFPHAFNPGLGFDGIVVSILAAHNPVGVVFSAFFFGALKNGALNMARLSDVPKSLVEIIQGTLILMVSAKYLFGHLKFNHKSRKSQAKDRIICFFRKTGSPGGVNYHD